MTQPKVSVIIPSYDGSRGGNVDKMKEDLKKQTLMDFELHIVVGVKPNGRARNVGVQKAKGEYLLFIDDDSRLGTEKLIENMIAIMEQDPSVGLVGVSQIVPDDANAFQKKCVKQLMRAEYPVVHEITESDMATHACMAIKRQVYLDVGGESDVLLRGTDPDLRFRLRKAGYRVVIAPETFVYNNPYPENLRLLLGKVYRNGMGSAWVFKNFPDRVYEAFEKDTQKPKLIRHPLFRWARRIFDLFLSLFTFRWLRFLYDSVYIAGYIRGLTLPNKKIEENIF